MTKYFPASLLIAALALVAPCNKPSPFGADLLDDQLADYAFSDSVSLRCSIVREDSVLTSDRTLTADFFLCQVIFWDNPDICRKAQNQRADRETVFVQSGKNRVNT